MKEGHVAIMQPYLFPYLGYFQLIEACDIFIFYDDVNYIKKGWINRNRIALQEKPALFTLPVKQASQNTLIKDTFIYNDPRWKKKFFVKLTQSYQKAPHFEAVMALIDSALSHTEEESIASVSIRAIELIYQYLDHEILFKRSSEISAQTQELSGSDRLIQITKDLGFTSYINAQGGKDLYSKSHFKNQGVDLHFLHSNKTHYKQAHHEFIPALSVIDILMFNNARETKELFSNFTLE